MFKFVGVVSDFVGDVGLGVIKHSAKIVWGGGEAIVGFATNDEELIAKGLKDAGTAAAGLGMTLVSRNINGSDSEGGSEE